MEGKTLNKLPIITAKKITINLGTAGNRKIRQITIKPITEITESEFNNKKYLWLNGKDAYLRYNDNDDGTVEVETNAKYLYINYYSGSWKNTYDKYSAIYDVEEERFLLKTDENEEKISNLRLEYVNAGYALSRDYPSRNYFAYYLLTKYTEVNNVEEQAKKLLRNAIELVGKEKVIEILGKI